MPEKPDKVERPEIPTEDMNKEILQNQNKDIINSDISTNEENET